MFKGGQAIRLYRKNKQELHDTERWQEVLRDRERHLEAMCHEANYVPDRHIDESDRPREQENRATIRKTKITLLRKAFESSALNEQPMPIRNAHHAGKRQLITEG